MKLTSRDCCPYLDDHEPNYVNPAGAAPQEVGHSATWDPDFVSDETSVPAGSHSSKRKLANSAPAGSESYIGLGDPSASVGAQSATDGPTLTLRTNMKVCPLSMSRKREKTHLEVNVKMKQEPPFGDRSNPSLLRARRTPYPANGHLPGVLSAAAGVATSLSLVCNINPKPAQPPQTVLHVISYPL